MLYTGNWLLAWRHPGQLPQDGNVARVTGLWRVREGSFSFLSMDALKSKIQELSTRAEFGSLSLRCKVFRNADRSKGEVTSSTLIKFLGEFLLVERTEHPRGRTIDNGLTQEVGGCAINYAVTDGFCDAG